MAARAWLVFLFGLLLGATIVGTDGDYDYAIV
jgi:hypothetical protein